MRLHNRLVKGDLWLATDVVEAVQEPLGLMLYQGMWHIADDSGCLPDDPLLWRQMLFGAFDGIDKGRLRELGDRLVEVGKLVRYEVDGKPYLWLRNFAAHQSLDYPSAPEFPLPAWIEWAPGSSRGQSHFRILAYLCPVPISKEVRRGFVLVTKQPDNGGQETGQPHEAGTSEKTRAHDSDASPTGQCLVTDTSLAGQCGDDETLSKFLVPPLGVQGSSGGQAVPEDASPREREMLHELSRTVSRDGQRYPLDYRKDLDHLRDLATRYPDVDLLQVCRDLHDWMLDHRVGTKANWRARLTRFAANASRWKREGRSRADPRARLTDVDLMLQEEGIYRDTG